MSESGSTCLNILNSDWVKPREDDTPDRADIFTEYPAGNTAHQATAAGFNPSHYCLVSLTGICTKNQNQDGFLDISQVSLESGVGNNVPTCFPSSSTGFSMSVSDLTTC